VLAVTTTPGLASLWLIPRLEAFVGENPHIDVRIDASLSARDLSVDGYDLAIRYASAKSQVGIPLFHETVQPVCAPALARDKSRPLKTPADLRHHTMFEVEVHRGSEVLLEWDLWAKAMGLPPPEPARKVIVTSYDAAISAAVAGQGVALGRRPLINSLLKRRQLVAPFGDELSSMRAYFLVAEPRAANRPAVRALHAWLIDQASNA
jgi:DNA-binding transcriptional LysR family regulator